MDDPVAKRLVRSELATGQFDLTRHGLDLDWFDPHIRSVADWIIQFKTQYGRLPTEDQVVEATKIEWTKEVEPVEYVAGVYVENRARFELDEGLRRAAKTLVNAGPYDAQRVLSELAGKQWRVTKSEGRAFVADGQSRYDRYLRRKTSPDSRGIPFPWPTLTEALIGAINGEFTLFMAPQSTGKSWSSCVVAANALTEGKRVLLITMEMLVEAFENRLDCVYYKIPFRDIRTADMDIFVEERWVSALAQPRDGEIFIYDERQVQHVDQIERLIDQHKPDLVVVDGGYRLKPRGRGQSWEVAANVVNDIQSACKVSNLPWVVTTQQNPPAGKRLNDVQLADSVRYAKEWVLCPENVVVMSQTQEQREFLREVNFRVVKMRETDRTGVNMEFKANWDLEFCDFSEIVEAVTIDGVDL